MITQGVMNFTISGGNINALERLRELRSSHGELLIGKLWASIAEDHSQSGLVIWLSMDCAPLCFFAQSYA